MEDKDELYAQSFFIFLTLFEVMANTKLSPKDSFGCYITHRLQDEYDRLMWGESKSVLATSTWPDFNSTKTFKGVR